MDQSQPLVRPLLLRGTAAALPRVTDRCSPVGVPTMAIKIESIAVLVIIRAPFRLLTSLFAPVLTAVVAVRVTRSSVVAIAGNLAIFQIRATWLLQILRSVLLGFGILLAKVAEHTLESPARHPDFPNRPDRRKEFPAYIVSQWK